MEEGVRSLWAGDVWRGICSGGSEARGKRERRVRGSDGNLECDFECDFERDSGRARLCCFVKI